MGFPCIRCLCCGRTDLYLWGPAVRPIGRPFGLQDHQAYLGTPPFFYSTVFKLSRLWNIRFRTSFLFFGSLVSEFTSPGLTSHNPRQSSTWVWFYTWHSSDLSSWVQGFQDLDGMQGQSQTLQTPIGVPGGSPQFRLLRPSGQDDAETHHELQGGRKFWMTFNLNQKDRNMYIKTGIFLSKRDTLENPNLFSFNKHFA